MKHGTKVVLISALVFLLLFLPSISRGGGDGLKEFKEAFRNLVIFSYNEGYNCQNCDEILTASLLTFKQLAEQDPNFKQNSEFYKGLAGVTISSCRIGAMDKKTGSYSLPKLLKIIDLLFEDYI